MKLIPLIILTMSTAVNVKSNEHFTFPPQFHPHHSEVMSPDRTVYLPPESHTTIPYYPMKNVNLPFPYLPSTATKAPVYFSTPFPMKMSSTVLSIENDNDNDEEDKLSPQIQKNNRTQRSPPPRVEKRELRPKEMNYQPIDRIDVKPFGYNPNQGIGPVQKATPRSLIISPPEHNVMDQYKSAGILGPQFIAAPNIPGVYLSSTTETAVPIIRLSNEMDLDGSFSYEALGADQTHYVQHSRMDNMGSEKQEQVVEGSYSYVGDNGQTYTVNYIADSNGFRASGDHLPVAPPIPEIIQRSIQYNLAEEAKKPPHMKSWQNEENELSESEKNQRYAIPPPPRNLFTGKTPESFSFAFSQGSQNTQNNLVPAASSQTPIKANIDFTPEQMKGKTNNGISPQITFLASQGAHVPSMNPQQTIGRVLTTERSTMPQLINYEAGLKDSEESNKALWRWQYGLNANIDQTPEKNSISRSFGEGDDVMINFNEMTPQQYSSMIQSELDSNNGSPKNDQNVQPSESVSNAYQQRNSHEHQKNIFMDQKQVIYSTENYYGSNQNIDLYQNNKQNDLSPNINQNLNENTNQNYVIKPYETVSNKNQNENSNENTRYVPTARAKLITQDKFIPPSQTVTHSYNYEDMVYEPQKLKPSTMEPLMQSASIFDSEYKQNGFDRPVQQFFLRPNSDQIQNEQISSTTGAPTTTTVVSEIQFTDFFIDEKVNDFRPFFKPEEVNKREEAINTADSDEDFFRDNIFLRNLFKTDTIEPTDTLKDENKINTVPGIKTERKHDKSPKLISVNSIPFNEIQTMKNKPLDMTDVMNYVSQKNHFESSKTKPKSKVPNIYNQRNEMRFIPVQQDRYEEERESMKHSDLRTNYYQPEVRGIIKNYKVLQRNNSAFTQEGEQLRRDLSPPPVKISSNLPPLGRAGPSMKSYLPPIYV
ncbi:putative cuticle protein [Operophtera brumata]|uniref:Putative cuticle protein n=1 Tax=Operophtera brumata TaxID=104452 RepID=A0A0L7LD83_OPEBR|nr:putative cuticle protein [Operophtera brumata]